MISRFEDIRIVGLITVISTLNALDLNTSGARERMYKCGNCVSGLTIILDAIVVTLQFYRGLHSNVLAIKNRTTDFGPADPMI